MTYTSTIASALVVRIRTLGQQIETASAQGFKDGATIRMISELGRLQEELEQEAVREYLSASKVEAA